MKTNQNFLGRWVAKLVSKGHRPDKQARAGQLPVLAAEQLKQVSGGAGPTTDGPNKGW